MFDWETPEERALKHMKVSPQKKMEWLYQMHQFILKASSKRLLAIRQKLREQRQFSNNALGKVAHSASASPKHR